jgi:hypothetical protein
MSSTVDRRLLVLVGIFALAGVLAVGFVGLGTAADAPSEDNDTVIGNSSGVSYPSLSDDTQSPVPEFRSAATTEPPEVVRVVEYDDSIEVTFDRGVVQNNTVNTSTTSGTGDQINERNITVSVDGTEYGDDGDFDVEYSSGTDPNDAGKDVAVTLVNGSWSGLDSGRNVTVKLSGIQTDTSGGGVTTVTKSVSVTDLSVVGGGGNDTQASAEHVTQGEVIALRGSPGEDIEVKTVGGTLELSDNFGNSTAIAVDTASFTTGVTYNATFGNSTDQFFNVTSPSFDVTIEDANESVVAGDDVVVDATIENTDTVNGTQTVEFTINGTTEATTSVSLNGSESTTETFRYTTSAADQPAIDVGLTTGDNTTTTTVTVNPGPVSIKSGVEAGGNVEVVTNTSLPQSDIAALELQLDGTVIYDASNFGDDGSGSPADSGITANAPDALHDVVVNTSYQRRHDIRLYDDSDNLVDITPNRDLTVTLTVNESDGVTTDVTQDITVTGATVAESEGLDSSDTAQRIYRGAPIAIWADVSGNDTSVFLDATGQDLSTGQDSRLLTLDSMSTQFNSGETVEVEFASNSSNVEYFEVRDLDWSVSAADTDVSSETTVEVTVSAARGGAPFTAEMRNTTGAVVATRRQTLGGDGTSTLAFDPQNIDGLSIEGSPYTVTATDNRTANSNTTAEITVGEPASFAVTITETNTPVAAGETLFVDAQVDNTGEKSGTQTVTLDVPELGRDSVDVTLNAGQSTTVTLAIPTGSGDVSDYTATVTSEDDSDSVAVTVEEAATFPVTITETTSPVTVGETLQVAAEVENTGDQSGSTTVGLTIDGQQRDAATVSLDAGESESVILKWSTEAGDAGGYIALVETATDDDTASVSVEPEQNEPPVATDDSYQADEGTTLSVPAADGVLANDVDPDGDKLTAAAVTQPDFGTLHLAANGSFTYTPVAGFTGTDSFTYQATDGDGGVDTAVVSIEVKTPATAALSTLDIAGQGTTATISEDADESVSVGIENVGGRPESFDVSLDVGDVSETQTTAVISPGASDTVTFDGVTDSLAPGEYEVTVSTPDDTVNGTLVVGPPQFDVTITQTTSPVLAGETLTVDAQVQNTGVATGTQTVALAVEGADQETTGVTLAGGESTTVSLSWTATERGTHAVSVGSADTQDKTAVWVGANESDLGPPAVVDGTPPQDLDGDGVYRDLNGDGTVSLADVQLLFEHRTDMVIQDHAEFFDVDGDGTITLADVRALYQASLEQP